jgi:NADP-dependent 3-hydroxy acid dehydrogenase YdfG
MMRAPDRQIVVTGASSGFGDLRAVVYAGEGFCDLAPAGLDDAILRGVRFHRRSG